MSSTTPRIPDAIAPALIDVGDVASMLSCSTRHVYRLVECKKMPPPVKLGALIRWPRSQIDAWISEGCPTPLSTSPLPRLENAPVSSAR